MGPSDAGDRGAASAAIAALPARCRAVRGVAGGLLPSLALSLPAVGWRFSLSALAGALRRRPLDAAPSGAAVRRFADAGDDPSDDCRGGRRRRLPELLPPSDLAPAAPPLRRDMGAVCGPSELGCGRDRGGDGGGDAAAVRSGWVGGIMSGLDGASEAGAALLSLVAARPLAAARSLARRSEAASATRLKMESMGSCVKDAAALPLPAPVPPPAGPPADRRWRPRDAEGARARLSSGGAAGAGAATAGGGTGAGRRVLHASQWVLVGPFSRVHAGHAHRVGVMSLVAATTDAGRIGRPLCDASELAGDDAPNEKGSSVGSGDAADSGAAGDGAGDGVAPATAAARPPRALPVLPPPPPPPTLIAPGADRARRTRGGSVGTSSLWVGSPRRRLRPALAGCGRGPPRFEVDGSVRAPDWLAARRARPLSAVVGASGSGLAAAAFFARLAGVPGGTPSSVASVAGRLGDACVAAGGAATTAGHV